MFANRIDRYKGSSVKRWVLGNCIDLYRLGATASNGCPVPSVPTPYFLNCRRAATVIPGPSYQVGKFSVFFLFPFFSFSSFAHSLRFRLETYVHHRRQRPCQVARILSSYFSYFLPSSLDKGPLTPQSRRGCEHDATGRFGKSSVYQVPGFKVAESLFKVTYFTTVDSLSFCLFVNHIQPPRDSHTVRSLFFFFRLNGSLGRKLR